VGHFAFMLSHTSRPPTPLGKVSKAEEIIAMGYAIHKYVQYIRTGAFLSSPVRWRLGKSHPAPAGAG